MVQCRAIGPHPFPQVRRYDDSRSQRLVPYRTLPRCLFVGPCWSAYSATFEILRLHSRIYYNDWYRCAYRYVPTSVPWRMVIPDPLLHPTTSLRTGGWCVNRYLPVQHRRPRSRSSHDGADAKTMLSLTICPGSAGIRASRSPNPYHDTVLTYRAQPVPLRGSSI